MALNISSDQVRYQANLRLLQRTCSPHITDIVQSATHVVLYEFLQHAWQKSNVEGSLFVVRLSQPPYTQLIILNRSSTDNLLMTVNAQLQLQHQDPYLILRETPTVSDNNATTTAPVTRIHGLWFHNADERNQVYQTLLEYTRSPPPVPPPPPTTTSSPSLTATLAATSLSQDVSAAPVEAKPPLATATPSPSIATHPSVTATRTLPTTSASPTFSSAAAAVAAAVATSPALTERSAALDKKALQLALLSLIQDDRFLDLLHSQYLRVVHARAKKGHFGNGGNVP
jgi:mRNA-decapping enzyme 1B